MSELFTYGSVGGGGHIPGRPGKAPPYPETDFADARAAERERYAA